VRFPDGFEASFTRDQLDVLKHFKDRLPSAGSSAGDFDLEQFIIYRCVVGSRAYGLDNDESDIDRRGIYLAPAELQWSLFGAPEQFEDNATQSCYWELQKFLTMALKANPNILECLYSPIVEKITPLGEEILAMRQSFLSQMIFQTFNGYAMSQFKKIERRSAEPRRGALETRHAPLAPAAHRGCDIAPGSVPVRVEAHRDRLARGQARRDAVGRVDAWRMDLHRDFDRALAETRLPERPDYEAANRILIQGAGAYGRMNSR
jgi:uncharacterized protein